MLGATDPREAYRRTTFDARVQGGHTADLVDLCLEQAIDSLGVALSAERMGRTELRSSALTRAMTAITALEMGVDGEAPLADALYQYYRSARQVILDCVVLAKPDKINSVRQDLAEMRDAFRLANAA